VATLLSLRERIAPPTLGYEVPDEGLDLDYVPDGPRPLEGANGRAIALSNSFGFGGHNAVLCISALTVLPRTTEQLPETTAERLTALDRLELLCDPGSLRTIPAP